MKILKKISKVIVIVMAVLATIWCGLYVYANYFYNDKQIDVENFYIAELPLTPSQFEEDFKEIHHGKSSVSCPLKPSDSAPLC